MITDGEKWHYLAVKRQSALFRGIILKRYKDFYFLNCFHSFRRDISLKSMKIYAKIMTCYVEMHKGDDKILKYNHGEKYMKIPFIIYADLESLLEKSKHLS